ncbi:hypothetical protein FNH05_09045 [Amycolatopsis rhizosphaerae]|uniref:DUF7847 domain-containing protein n=1 Tax=Amycolatopsis rhizosphaerae TaxID=2053003 RepID=A0A558D449_9PSEU|nr:hypothetical protein [Amycolatopsis rhizosphaerae]TVT55763.1 hypothetical protein FNH05_09045 [Amycolatopsis rhizosphaerae]
MSDTGGWNGPDQPGYPGPAFPPPPVSPQPGVIPLRPLGVGEILDGAFATMRRHPGLVFGFSALVAVIGAVADFALTRSLLGGVRTLQPLGPAATQQEQLAWFSETLRQTAVAGGITFVVGLLTSTFLSGFMTIVVGKAVLGRRVELREVLAELKPRLLPLLGLTVLYMLIVGVATVFFIVPGVWLYVLFALAAPALVLEQSGIGTAFGRSRLLVQGSWWRVFGILLLTGLVTILVTGIIEVPFGLGLGRDSELAQYLGQAVSSTIVAPFAAGASALLYIDQRMRREGMDIQLTRAAAAGQ